MRWRVSISLVFLALGLEASHAVTLTRAPSIWLRVETSVLIAWQTNLAAPGKVLYGTTTALGNEASHDGSTVNHAVPLAGLAPGTVYYYRVVSDPDTLTDGSDWFRTAPDGPEPLRFVAFGDLGRVTPAQLQVASRVEMLGADLALLTGDIIYEAGEAVNFTPQYFDIYRPTIRRIPFYPCLGNHDVATLNGQPYLDAFYLPNNNPAMNERYYSFDYVNAHFVALECVTENTPQSAAMLDWLDADLAASNARWKFVSLHVPIYSNGGVHGNDTVTRAQLEPIFTARGVDVVFQGHNHYYTRTYPIASGVAVDTDQNPNYIEPGGPVYIVTGGGGRFLHALGAVQPFEVFSKSTYHVTVVDVVGDSLALQAIEPNGTVIDAMSIVKETVTAIGPLASDDALESIQVGAARPSPFGVETEIPITIRGSTSVRVTIVDVSGRTVRTIEAGDLGAGTRIVRWDGRDDHGATVAAGIYFARVQAGPHTAQRRLIFLR